MEKKNQRRALIKMQKLKCLGRVLRMDVEITPTILRQGRIHGNRKRGRPIEEMDAIYETTEEERDDISIIIRF